MVKCLPTMQETWVQSLGQEDPLKKEMATHSSILAWKIPWTEEPGGLYSPWGCKESEMTEYLTATTNQTFSGSSDGKVSAYNAGDLGSILGSGRSPGDGNGNLLHYSCLENSMD